jgi:succinyldiaminopimelate transaminase
VVREALSAAADSPGYPTVHGTPALRDAVVRWFARRRGVPGLDPAAVLPTVGSKELVALLPSMLGLGAGDVVLHPAVAYPTYDVGARLAGATPEPSLDPAARLDQGRGDVRLVWLNSPGNPDGSVLDVARLRAVVTAARAAAARDGRPVLVVSDECYAELAWDAPWATEGVPSLLDPRVTGGDVTGLLAAYSLSKQSNLAGYRASFVAGDPAVVAALLEIRKHAGMIVPGPVQAATTVALDDDEHVATQRERYRRRRGLLRSALEDAGYAVDSSHAGLYLWVRPEAGVQDSWQTVGDLAGLGILVAPGAFYGPAGAGHVRVALTASDEAIAEAAARLRGA